MRMQHLRCTKCFWTKKPMQRSLDNLQYAESKWHCRAAATEAAETCLGRQAEHVAAGQLEAGQARCQRAVAREGHDRHVVVPVQRCAVDPQQPEKFGRWLGPTSPLVLTARSLSSSDAHAAEQRGRAMLQRCSSERVTPFECRL